MRCCQIYLDQKGDFLGARDALSRLYNAVLLLLAKGVRTHAIDIGVPWLLGWSQPPC